MSLMGADYHERMFGLSQAMGDPVIAGDSQFVPIGYEFMGLLMKGFVQPYVTGGEGIDNPLPGGGIGWVQSPMETRFTGGVQIKESRIGHAAEFMRAVVAAGGYFDAWIYEGTTEKYVRRQFVKRCFIKVDPSERDWESRQQIQVLSGTIYGHFFGRYEAGNVTA